MQTVAKSGVRPVVRSSTRRAPVRCSASTTQVLTRAPAVVVSDEAPAEIDVEALYHRLEARAKAMIALDEQEMSQRTRVKFVLQQKVGLGEAWKIVGKCPELGNFVPEVAPYMKWNAGDVWTLEIPVRSGQFAYKAVLRKADGIYLWEDGKDRMVEVGFNEGVKEMKITNIKFPAF